VDRSRLLFGGAVVAVGLVLLGGALDVWDAGDVISTWWPLVLVAAGALAWVANPRHPIGPIIVMLVGAALLVDRLDIVSVDAAVVWPVVIIAAGLAVLFSRPRRTYMTDDRVKAFTAFGGTEIASHSHQFEGGSIGAVFGAAEVDLRDAELAPGASLDVFTAFGGTEVRVPEGWKVRTHGLPIFAGFENITAKETLTADAPALDINATVIFGGLEVKH